MIKKKNSQTTSPSWFFPLSREEDLKIEKKKKKKNWKWSMRRI